MSINLSKKKIIALVVIGILIIICVVLGITYSFMRPINETSSITSVSLNSCANITLTDTGESIDLENTYPMSRNRALQTTPYTFTVSSTCPDSTGFNIYIATLNTNTLDASNIHYIITEQGNTNVIAEGILSEAPNGLSDFQDYEISDLNNGINGTYGSIYRLYTRGIQEGTEVSYDLYLYIDESVTNETMGQTFRAGVAIKTSDYDFATVNEITVTETTTDSITVSVNATAGTNAIQNYFYSINNGEYVSSSNNTYTFSDLDLGTEYNIKVYVVDTNGINSNIYTMSVKTENLTYICDSGTTLASCIRSQYTSQGSNGIYYHTSSLANSAEDNSYRYAGANPNNYVCFGSDSATCPSDSLYRIIGVFGDEVKLIKSSYANSSLLGVDGTYSSDYLFYWGTSAYDVWNNSNLNLINLNTNYLNNISSNFLNQIATHSWYLGGGIQGEIIKDFYDSEHNGATYSAKIGLMYVSDYGYAADPNYWYYSTYSNDGNDYRVAADYNWLLLGDRIEWTMVNNSEYRTGAFNIQENGSVGSGSKSIFPNAIRPCFYLNSVVQYSSGIGTESDPIRLVVDSSDSTTKRTNHSNSSNNSRPRT